MGADSKIQWTHHTFNPHWGCVKVSPGCKNCYAETFSKRVGFKIWGQGGDRREFGDKHWAEPLKWDAKAKTAGERRRVFCASMADVFEDHPVAARSRDRLWPLIEATKNLDWLLLTKRPENIDSMLPDSVDQSNIWLGTTAENQEEADKRIPILIRQDKAAIRFVSAEPLLGPIDFDMGRCYVHDRDYVSDDEFHCTECCADGYDGVLERGRWFGQDHDGIDWAIVGGESGPGARPFDIAWAREIVRQCNGDGVACFVKQMGANSNAFEDLPFGHSRKGDEPSEWPEDLRVRQFPGGTP